MEVLQAKGLTKTYGKFTAVDNLSLAVTVGEIYGLLGLNGAGKTTTIRMFLDMIKASSGDVKLFGIKASSGDPLWNQIGYLVETPGAYPDLSVVENLRIYARYRKIFDSHVIDSILHRLHLETFRNIQSKNLSLGNRQRLGLAKALFHNPKLLILDEPTNGLDPQGIVEFRTLLKTLAREGTTIFISSHLLDEVARTATRIGILHEGKLIREVYSSDLDQELQKSLIIKSTDGEQCKALLTSLGYEFSFNTNTRILKSDSPLAVNDREVIAKQIIGAGLSLSEFYVDTEDLEGYFLKQINRNESHD